MISTATTTLIDNQIPGSRLKYGENDMKVNHPNVFGLSEMTNGIIDSESINKINIQEKLKCIIRAIDEALKGTKEITIIWKETKQQLGFVLMRMKSCRREQTITDEIK